MTIHDCISKHSLTQRNVSRGGKWVPASLAVPRGDDFEVFGNDDGPLVVGAEHDENQFKIVHGGHGLS